MRLFGKRFYINKNRILPVFGIGFLLGVFIVNLWKSVLLSETGIYNESVLYQMKYMTVDRDTLFCYILRKRILFFGGMIVMSTTYLGILFCFFNVLRCGISMGIYLTSLVIRYGLKGVCFAVIGIFPQGFFYLPAFFLLLYWCEEMCVAINFHANKGAEDKKSVAKKIWIILLSGLLTVLGCLTEGYWNPRILTAYLKIF